MNLFLNPSIHDLQALIQSAPEISHVHNLVVDYDGEVLIDPQLEQPDLDLNRFKFRVQLSEFSKRMIMKGSANLKFLYNKLVQAWNTGAEHQRFSLA